MKILYHYIGVFASCFFDFMRQCRRMDENIDMQLQKIKMSKCIKMKKKRKKSRFIEEKPWINTKETYAFWRNWKYLCKKCKI